MKPSAHNKEGPELQRLPVLGWNFVIYIVLCKKTNKETENQKNSDDEHRSVKKSKQKPIKLSGWLFKP